MYKKVLGKNLWGVRHFFLYRVIEERVYTQVIKEGNTVSGRGDTLDFMGNKKIGDRKKG